MPELTRQEMDEIVGTSNPELGDPLGNSSLESFSATLDSLKKGVDQGSEVALALINFLYTANNPLGNKILKLYRTNCLFRKAIRNATLDALNNAGLIYSRRRDKACITNIDNVFLATSLASLTVNIAIVVNQFYKD